MNVIPMNIPAEQEPTCSFCKKTKTQVKNLVAGKDALHHICNECINKATERMKHCE